MHCLSMRLWLRAAHTMGLGLTQKAGLGESLIRNLIPYVGGNGGLDGSAHCKIEIPLDARK